MKTPNKKARNFFDNSSLGSEAESRFSSVACSATNRATFPKPKPQERQNFCSIGASDPQFGQCIDHLLKPVFFTFKIHIGLLETSFLSTSRFDLLVQSRRRLLCHTHCDLRLVFCQELVGGLRRWLRRLCGPLS